MNNLLKVNYETDQPTVSSKRDSMIGFQECVNMASKMAWISTYSKLSKFKQREHAR